jgi:hypothetical protein
MKKKCLIKNLKNFFKDTLKIKLTDPMKTIPYFTFCHLSLHVMLSKKITYDLCLQFMIYYKDVV